MTDDEQDGWLSPDQARLLRFEIDRLIREKVEVRENLARILGDRAGRSIPDLVDGLRDRIIQLQKACDALQRKLDIVPEQDSVIPCSEGFQHEIGEVLARQLGWQPVSSMTYFTGSASRPRHAMNVDCPRGSMRVLQSWRNRCRHRSMISVQFSDHGPRANGSGSGNNGLNPDREDLEN